MDWEKHAHRGKLYIFVSYYKKHLGLFGLDMLCALGIALVDISFPLVSKHALESLLPGRLYIMFFTVMGILIAAYGLRSVFYYIVTYWGHTLGVRMEADIRSDLFSHLQKLSFRFYDKNRTGQLMSRVTNDLFDITELAHHGPEDLFIALLTLLGAFMVMLQIQWRLALVLLLMVPIIIGFVLLQRRSMARASRAVKERVAGINADLESSISGARVAKAFANEDYEITKFEHGNERFKTSKSFFYRRMAVLQSGLEFMTSLLSVLVILVGGTLIMQGRFTYPELITFTLYVGIFLQPIRRLSNFIEQYSIGMAGFERFVELMRIRPDIEDSPDARPLQNVRGHIELRDVSFSYDEGRTVLSHINLTAAPGKKLAIVGASGGGKTTLCHLIPRFYEPTGGDILIDGVNIRQVTLTSLRANIGIVQQEVFLFAGTMRENIAYGRVGASDEEIIAAAKLAHIHADIMAMPDGYHTMAGERGILLSGGQKQRISIARIFLKNPPILILDEATSALDTQTEAEVQHAFDRLAKGRTTLIIAHRLSTIQNADEIIVLEEKGIAARGTHAQLIAQNGLYTELYRAFQREEQPGERS
ncbi:MAG: ABC transporter ATP-binding protein [Syntrophomonadaceae bacterium]|nr:ABC transporter ATP-binding protein [Syntrophomonadaceae bacterium]